MRTKLFLIIFLAFCSINSIGGVPTDEGKTLFTSRCGNCHNVNKKFVGPALAGVHERRSMDWIVNFVRSSQTVIKSGDKDAAALYAEYKIPMPDHPDLNADNIKNIVEYIKTESNVGIVPEAPFKKPLVTHPSYLPLSISNYWFFSLLLGTIGVLIYSLLLKVRITEYKKTGVWK